MKPENLKPKIERQPVIATGEAFATVGRFTEPPTDRVELKWEKLDKPKIHNGKELPFRAWILERKFDADGERRRVVAFCYVETQAMLDEALKQFERQLPAIRDQLFKPAKNQPKPTAKEPAPKPPARCEPINEDDHAKRRQAIVRNLAREYPRTIKLMRQQAKLGALINERSAAALQNKYLADVAAITGTWLEATNPEAAQAIGEALLSFHKNGGVKSADAVDWELVFHWFSAGYCYMSRNELAAAINSKCGTKHTSAAILKRRQRLGLPSKRPPGPDFKFNG